MNAKIVAEELLILMAYGVDLMMFPTFRNWDQSYEGWLYKNGLLSRIHYLEAQKFLARQRKSEGKGSSEGWVFEVTKAGHERVCGGRDPEKLWQRSWDGWWRQFVFDLPLHQNRARFPLLRWLRRNGFGYLQDSVWISPDPATEVANCLEQFRGDAEAFTILECRCAPGFTNATLVKGAWPFAKIQESYRAYRQFAVESTKQLLKSKLHPRELFGLLRAERAHWSAAFDIDPLLPLALWPSDYEGRRAWQARQDLLRLAANHAKGK